MRLDHSRIVDPESSEDEGVGKKLFTGAGHNESLRKMIFKGDIDKESVFYEMILTPLTPRSIGLKLHLFKGAAAPKVEIDIEKF
jgi:hypothetical protein